ncbi:MAG: PilZ domain-containing protein [candidate division NC10 bacterium]
MKTNLGRVSRNESEAIHVSLRKADGRQYVELRVYSRSKRHGRVSLPAREAIAVPVSVLSDLCRILTQTQYRLLTEQLGHGSSPAHGITKRARKRGTLHGADGRGHRANRRREPRVPVRLPVQCYLLGAPRSSPSKPRTGQVTGQIWDVSSGGAQIWLPERFPVLGRLVILMQIGEPIFRGYAEVLGATVQPRGGMYRHNLHWLPLNPQAKAALSKLTGPSR